MEMSGLLLAGSQTAAAALIAGVWQGLLLAGMIWICLKVVPKTSAGIRFFVWLAVFISVAMLPLLSFLPLLHTNTGGPSTTQAAPLVRVDLRWALGIVALWLTVSAWQGFELVRNGLRLRSLRKGSTLVKCGPAIAALLSTARFRKAQLCSSPEIDQPCVLGFFAPRILVPEWLLQQASSSDLEQIVLHEVAHLRRMDDWANLLQKAILVAYPLNPALFWIEKQLCEEREMACDESVVRATKAPRDYAACLVNLAGERMTRRRVAALSLGAWERRTELAGRIRTILSGQGQMSPWKARTVMATLLLATASGAVELGKSSQLVAFTAMPESPTLPAMAERTTTPKLKYQDVVYREPARVVPAALKSTSPEIEIQPKAIQAGTPAASQPTLIHVSRKSVPTARRVSLNAPASRTFIVFTQWETSFGPRTTVTLIQTNVQTNSRSVADPAALSSSGWYVFQL